MLEKEKNNLKKVEEAAKAANKRVVKVYRAFEGDLRAVIESDDGSPERWTLSSDEPRKM